VLRLEEEKPLDRSDDTMTMFQLGLASAKRGSTRQFVAFISNGGDPLAKDESRTNWTLAHELALQNRVGSSSVAVWEMRKKGTVDPVDAELWTPLMVAALEKNANIVDIYLEAGADMLKRNSEGKSALGIAKESGDAILMSVFNKHRLRRIMSRIAERNPHGLKLEDFPAAQLWKQRTPPAEETAARASIRKIGR
jgi:hypothetical protein